jgi:hypothetical protein
MAIDGNTTCAVPGCGALISGPNNLCNEHRLPGMGVRVGGSTMVITAWYAEHGDEAGVILLNDWAMGAHFGGGAGFEGNLREQGFVNVGNLATPEEVEAAKKPGRGKKVGDWAGPWKTQYPWEIGSPISVDQEEISSEKDNA